MVSSINHSKALRYVLQTLEHSFGIYAHNIQAYIKLQVKTEMAALHFLLGAVVNAEQLMS